MFDKFFVTNACFNTALPHCLFIEYEFQVCVCVSANDIKLVQALGNIISSAMKCLFLWLTSNVFHAVHHVKLMVSGYAGRRKTFSPINQ